MVRDISTWPPQCLELEFSTMPEKVTRKKILLFKKVVRNKDSEKFLNVEMDGLVILGQPADEKLRFTFSQPTLTSYVDFDDSLSSLHLLILDCRRKPNKKSQFR